MALYQPPTDPRPDLPDTDLWSDLLHRAWLLDGDVPVGEPSLFWSLEGLRCEGAGLVRGDGTLRLVAGEIDPEQYLEWRTRWLVPHREALVRILAQAEVRQDVAGQYPEGSVARQGALDLLAPVGEARQWHVG